MGWDGLQGSCNFGGWIGLEVVVLGLDLLEVEDLGFHRNGVLKDLVCLLKFKLPHQDKP
jgi:hypothetical protein